MTDETQLSKDIAALPTLSVVAAAAGHGQSYRRGYRSRIGFHPSANFFTKMELT